MKHPQRVFLFIILTLACAVAAFADAVIRPRDGTLDWTIVCGPDDGGHERKAADELASLIERMIGAKPKVVSVTNKMEVENYPKYIAIGRPAVELGAVSPKSKFKIDGSVVVIEDNRILLAGESPVASYFAMTRLAEMAGCRWYMPGRLGECIPKKDSLTFKAGTYNEVPFMWQRALGMNGYNYWPEGPAGYNQWTLHNRQGGVGLATGHAWADWLPPDKYFAKHPEWFSGNDTERHPWGICMTNEEAVQEFINNIRKSLDASPGQTTISLSQDDGFPYCRCKNCDALNSGLRDPIDPLGLPHITDSLVHFYNRIATEIEKTHPGIRYGFLAYLNSLKPPVKEKLHPALVPQIAPMHYSAYHPIDSPRSESIRALGAYIDGWSKLTEAWSYYGYGIWMAGSGMPYVREIETRHDWPYMADRGLKYVCIESSLGWQNLLPYHYLIARLNLDPYADPEPIVSEFYNNFFGPAAADMRAYLGELNMAFDSLEHEPGGSYVAPLVFTPERMKKLGRFLKSAERKAKSDPILKERVAMWRFGYRCAEERMRMRSQINHFRFQEASDTADRIWALFEGQKTANPETICPLWWEAGKNEWKGRANVTAKALKGANILYKFPDEWLVFLDYARAGAEKKMYAPNISLGPWRKVKTYSKLLSEQGFLENYGLYMWYRNAFQLKPEDLKGKIRIHFAEVDHTMWSIYVNGKKVDGQGLSGWTEPFDFDITDFVKPGENLVVCEIEGTFWEGAGGILSPVVIYSPAESP